MSKLKAIFSEAQAEHEDGGVIHVDACTPQDNENWQVVAYIHKGKVIYRDALAMTCAVCQEVIREAVKRQVPMGLEEVDAIYAATDDSGFERKAVEVSPVFEGAYIVKTTEGDFYGVYHWKWGGKYLVTNCYDTRREIMIHLIHSTD